MLQLGLMLSHHLPATFQASLEGLVTALLGSEGVISLVQAYCLSWSQQLQRRRIIFGKFAYVFTLFYIWLVRIEVVDLLA
jgi:hypothetical protein